MLQWPFRWDRCDCAASRFLGDPVMVLVATLDVICWRDQFRGLVGAFQVWGKLLEGFFTWSKGWAQVYNGLG